MYHLNWGNLLWLKELHLKWAVKKPTSSVEDVGNMHFMYKKEYVLPVALVDQAKLDIIIGLKIKLKPFLKNLKLIFLKIIILKNL